MPVLDDGDNGPYAVPFETDGVIVVTKLTAKDAVVVIDHFVTRCGKLHTFEPLTRNVETL